MVGAPEARVEAHHKRFQEGDRCGHDASDLSYLSAYDDAPDRVKKVALLG
jgi:hypothetical protein